jgi:hypothetical protein
LLYGLDGKYVPPTAAIHLKTLPWRYLENEPLWLATGIDCFGHLDRPPRMIYALVGRIIPWTSIPFIFASGMLVDSRFFLGFGIEFNPSDLAYSKTSHASLPSDFVIDVRTLEQIKEECCPPQLETLMFEGV